MTDKKARGGQRAGAGRPATLEQPKKITVSLDSPTIALLLSISPNMSEAIRTLARQSSDNTERLSSE
jgi:hypothetical protein